MSDLKTPIEKTEELTRRIWLAGLGAYGQSFDNLQNGYDKMNDQSRKIFDDLVARGEKLESDAKEMLEGAGDKLKEQAEVLRERSKAFTVDSLDLNINERLAEIRSKISEKVNLPNNLSVFGGAEKAEEPKKAAKASKAKTSTSRGTAAKKTSSEQEVNAA